MPWARTRSPPATTRASASTRRPAATSCCARVDDSKDQTYFLFGLTQAQLARTLFPLGELTKPEVRELARAMDLAVAAKGDSQEICFVPNGDYAAFLDAYLQGDRRRPRAHTRGEIVTTDGRTLGEHEGVHHFTVGQRRGLGIATGEPLYVISTDAASQRVVVGGNDELLRARFFAREVNWISIAGLAAPAARAGEDPQQARRRARHAACHGRSRARGSGLRRAAARRHARPGRGLLRGRPGAGRRLDRVGAGSIVIAGLKKIDRFAGDAVHQAVFLRDTA